MDKLFTKITTGLIIVNIATIAIILIFLQYLPPVVPLLYGLPYGEEQLAVNWALIIPPFVAGSFSAVNLLISQSTKDKFLKEILIGLTIVATSLSLITVLKIIFLVK